jgi:hypothetical protein
VARLYPQALGSVFVACYDSQGYGGAIGPRLPNVYFIAPYKDPNCASFCRRRPVTLSLVGPNILHIDPIGLPFYLASFSSKTAFKMLLIL